ncbi:cell division protein FtsZ [Hoeflea prorocentri]|uniref:Cell division protein FtsZ n=1 Tax=Hoeflea prorocentri TaxID=1922333 RepID=A0A9X3ZGL4_9HYPH|nr:cell division protein FtsZ [Hoeflea prorocentri]MCY6379921.1 cell division protein FtsZ [Hoeflea prorocentri]MDA5397721.1 cell division protein FtsZ [Hoeflea prorocentri]
MTINLQKPDITELKPRITVFGVGGGGGNAVNNMINAGLQGVDFVVANTDAQALTMTKADRVIQMGVAVTEGLGAGSQPEVGCAAARECIDEINDHLNGTHMCFVTAGMGGGTGTGAAPVVAEAARERGILTVGVVTKPFHFEGQRRMRIAEEGILELQNAVDTLIVIPNQNLFRIANDKTTFADAFGMADQVLYSGVACITDLMVKEGLINLDFADVRSVMREMGKAMMGTGEASGEARAMAAAEAAISNPLLDETSMKGAEGLLISITGGRDMTLFEVDEAATRIREEVDTDANIILGATFDEDLEGLIRVSVVATGIDREAGDEESAPTQITAPVKPAVAQPAQRPAAPAAPVAPPADQVEATIQLAEAELEKELAIAVPAEPAAEREEFHPQSKLFAQSDAPKPIVQSRATPQVAPQAAPQPVAQAPAQPAPVVQAAAAPAQPHEPAPKMPRIEDFPPVVQAEVDQQQRPAASQDERGPMGLLKRISNSLGRREDEEAADPRAAAPAAPSQRRQLSAEASMYAPRKGALDDQGRAQPSTQAQSEDDQLEIPAFLRRQAM